jgi:(R,R)-butanediol dehydrogenase / meso-butanediol dehydrogenase / diacetyl reductase
VLALRIHGRQDLQLETVSAPPDPLADQVLIRPRSCGICGTDLHEFAMGPVIVRTAPHPLTGACVPQILGHEFAGDVIAVGTEVRNVKPGDRVAVMPLISCGNCRYCRSGQRHLCELMACTGLTDPSGGMAELALVHEYQVHPLSENLSYDEGALIEPAAVALRAVERAKRKDGESALITGAGPIGVLVAIVGRAMGLGTIFMAEPNLRRRDWLERAGVCDLAIDPTDVDVGHVVARLTSAMGVDIAFECAGQQSALDTCFAAVRRGGTVVQTALFTKAATVDPYQWCFKDLRIEATWGYLTDMWPRLIALAGERRLGLERLVTARVPLDRAAEGFHLLLAPDSSDIKVMIDCG